MQQSPAFQLHHNRIDTACLAVTVPDVAQTAPIEPHTSWAEAALSVEEVTYIGTELVEVLGNVAIINDQNALDAPAAALTTIAHHANPTPQAPRACPSPSPASPVIHLEEALAGSWLQQADYTMPPWVELGATEDRGYKPKPKKGKPLPKGPLKRQREATCGWKIVCTGPDFIGCTTLLRGLERLGHHIHVAANKPTATSRHQWHQQYFDHLVEQWSTLHNSPHAMFVEDSPWAYLTKHGHQLHPSTREACHVALLPLKLPALTISLHSSGREVGRRHPLYRHSPETYSAVAL